MAKAKISIDARSVFTIRFTKFIPISERIKWRQLLQSYTALPVVKEEHQRQLLRFNVRPERFGRSTCRGLKFGGDREDAREETYFERVHRRLWNDAGTVGPTFGSCHYVSCIQIFFLEQARAVCIIIPEQLYAHRLLLSPLSLSSSPPLAPLLCVAASCTIARLVVILAFLLVVVARQRLSVEREDDFLRFVSRADDHGKYECINA